MLIALAIAPILLLAGLWPSRPTTASNTIPDRVSALFEGTAAAPSNSPDRLTQTSSLRARYWNDAFKVFDKHPWHGTGADTYSVSRLPFRTDTIQVLHAHGFIPQVMADLGLFGLGDCAGAGAGVVGRRTADPRRRKAIADEVARRGRRQTPGRGRDCA